MHFVLDLKYNQFVFQMALPIRLKQVHVINAPSSIDKIFAIMKPFLKKELTELVSEIGSNAKFLDMSEYGYLENT